ncbi:MAG TPA: hypothetical protein VGB31_06035 [Myxococcota bacterium]
MDESAYLGGVVAGLVYVVASVRLIRLSWQSQRSHELLLGLSLLLWGLSYVCWQIPIATANQPLTQPLFFAGRVLTHAGTIFFSIFIWITFRNRSRWAKYLVYAIAFGLIAGVAGSIAVGDWEGIRPMANPWWWLDWAAGSIAMSWVGVEGFIEYPKARQRVRLGACDPLVCNRYLLWGVVGMVWALYNAVLLYQTVEFESDQVWSIAIDRTTGMIEATGIALVWLIFFPPRFYRRWIAGAAPAAEPEEA